MITTKPVLMLVGPALTLVLHENGRKINLGGDNQGCPLNPANCSVAEYDD